METKNPVNTLQEAINKAAEARLKKDLRQLYESMESNKLLNLKGLPELYVKKPTYEQFTVTKPGTVNSMSVACVSNYEGDSITRLFGVHDTCNIWGVYSKILFEHWLPHYIKEETENFLNRIKKVEQEVEELYSSVQDLGNRPNY